MTVKTDKRIRMFTGHYGSGKTEVSVNYALKLAQVKGTKIAFADMDIVNPYFRSREAKETIEQAGIRMLDSSVNTSADVPAIPAAMYAPFQDKSYQYIIDLGGNDVGLSVLGRYKEMMDPKEIDFFMVINCYRPDTDSVEKILAEKQKLEQKAGLQITGLINNTNFIRATKTTDILYGDMLLKHVSECTNTPIKYTTYMQSVIPQICPQLREKIAGELLPLAGHLRADWM